MVSVRCTRAILCSSTGHLQPPYFFVMMLVSFFPSGVDVNIGECGGSVSSCVGVGKS